MPLATFTVILLPLMPRSLRLIPSQMTRSLLWEIMSIAVPTRKGLSIASSLSMPRGSLSLCARGDREIMMLASRYSKKKRLLWQRRGGKETLTSYSKSGKSRKLSNIPDEHWDFLENRCVNYWETDYHFFVRANACPTLPLYEQPEKMLFWEKFKNPPPHFSGKTMVCGHTSQKSGLPLNIGHAVCIDTRIHSKGWVSCFDVTSGRVWQANKKGQVRTGWIYNFASGAIAL